MNFYEYLGIKQTAQSEDIRKAFRKLAKITHPDYNSKDNAFWEMVELNIIRDTLLDSKRRHEYDQSLLWGTSDSYYPTQSTTQKKVQQKINIYKTVKELFTYKCQKCGIELKSTWRGYCLYHYLESTSQLYNHDFVFEYGKQLYRWADPPPEIIDEHKSNKTAAQHKIEKVRPVQIVFYIIFLLFIFGLLIFYISKVIQ